MQKFLKLSLLAVAATTLVACGGSDNDDNAGTTFGSYFMGIEKTGIAGFSYTIHGDQITRQGFSSIQTENPAEFVASNIELDTDVGGKQTLAIYTNIPAAYKDEGITCFTSYPDVKAAEADSIDCFVKNGAEYSFFQASESVDEKGISEDDFKEAFEEKYKVDFIESTDIETIKTKAKELLAK